MTVSSIYFSVPYSKCKKGFDSINKTELNVRHVNCGDSVFTSRSYDKVQYYISIRRRTGPIEAVCNSPHNINNLCLYNFIAEAAC